MIYLASAALITTTTKSLNLVKLAYVFRHHFWFINTYTLVQQLATASVGCAIVADWTITISLIIFLRAEKGAQSDIGLWVHSIHEMIEWELSPPPVPRRLLAHLFFTPFTSVCWLGKLYFCDLFIEWHAEYLCQSGRHCRSCPGTPHPYLVPIHKTWIYLL